MPAPERFRGEVEPVDPVAGHIPGAENLPSTSVLTADGTLLSEDELSALAWSFGGSGQVGVYCGSGVTAAVLVSSVVGCRRGHGAVPRVVVAVECAGAGRFRPVISDGRSS